MVVDEHIPIARSNSAPRNAVALSMPDLWIEGNLPERCFKIINLWTAILFVLFFLAHFVKWSNTIGAWIGLPVSILTAVLVAYAGDQGLPLQINLVGMMPCWLRSGMVIGALARCPRVPDPIVSKFLSLLVAR